MVAAMGAVVARQNRDREPGLAGRAAVELAGV